MVGRGGLAGYGEGRTTGRGRAWRVLGTWRVMEDSRDVVGRDGLQDVVGRGGFWGRGGSWRTAGRGGGSWRVITGDRSVCRSIGWSWARVGEDFSFRTSRRGEQFGFASVVVSVSDRKFMREVLEGEESLYPS